MPAGETARDQHRTNGFGAAQREGIVGRVAADPVGVSDDDDIRHGVRRDRRQHVGEDLFRRLGEFVAALDEVQRERGRALGCAASAAPKSASTSCAFDMYALIP
jgi:hypothetical protein